MDKEERLRLVLADASEVVTEAEIAELLESGRRLRAYAGYEPSGRIHLGHALSVNKLSQLQRAGIEVVVLLADLHAYLNGKGELEEIRGVAEYNRRCFLALGLDEERTRFVLGSEIQLDKDYFMVLQRLALSTTLLRARRSMDVISRVKENPTVAMVLYPLMQVADMVALDVDIAVGGLDQRKIHMLARDNLPKLGMRAPSFIHLPIIHGLDGDEKMSSSKGNFVAVDDQPGEVERKIMAAYCPMGVSAGNPVLEMYRYHVFPRLGEVKIERPERYGGSVTYNNYINLERDFVDGKIHPADLKSSLHRELNRLLRPVRDRFERG